MSWVVLFSTTTMFLITFTHTTTLFQITFFVKLYLILVVDGF